jgi:hypothetical protein
MPMRTSPIGIGIVALLLIAIMGVSGTPPALADQAIDPAIAKQFEHLSNNGNSNCSAAFMKSIPSMSMVARLQGSCCSPMNLEHYAKQLEGLKTWSAVAEIPPDPYDIPAGLAQPALAACDMALSPEEQKAYDDAMAHSEEKGPCCCQCWRWHVYGGLAKLLIHQHGFTGKQVTQLWDLSDGCGGGA